MKNDQKFRKAERLCHKKLIEELFQSGRSFYSYPFRLVWMPVTSPIDYSAQMAISVQKRHFKKAVDRNLLKRRVREAYRKNKGELYIKLEELNIRIVFMMIYSTPEILDYNEIEGKIKVVLSRLKEEISRGE